MNCLSSVYLKCSSTPEDFLLTNMTRQMTTPVHVYLLDICIVQSTEPAIVRTANQCTCQRNGRSSDFAYFNYLSLAAHSLKAEDQYTYINKTSIQRNRIAFSNCYGSALETKTAKYIKRIVQSLNVQAFKLQYNNYSH